jgi:hypothetical protein
MGAQLGEDVVFAEAGALVFKPRNQWHTFWNAGDTPCRVLEIISPAGFEHFFNELGEQMAAAKAVSVAAVPDVAGLAAGYGHYFQPESIGALCQQHGLVSPRRRAAHQIKARPRPRNLVIAEHMTGEQVRNVWKC